MSVTSDRLKDLVEKSEYTFEKLGKITGIAKSSIQRYASGSTYKIPVDAIEKLADCVGSIPITRFTAKPLKSKVSAVFPCQRFPVKSAYFVLKLINCS